MGKKHKRIKRETLISYLMIAPEMILMLIFIFIPIVYAFYISLFDWNAMGTKTFVGISNYLKMMQDLTFKSSLLVTGKYALIYVLTVYVLSLAAAVFVNSIRSNKRQARRELTDGSEGSSPWLTSGCHQGLGHALVCE